MNSPNFESYVGILQVLGEKGRLSATNIAAKVKTTRSMVEKCLTLLAEQGMVSKTGNNNGVVYDITNSGRKVLKFFKLDNSPRINCTHELSLAKARR